MIIFNLILLFAAPHLSFQIKVNTEDTQNGLIILPFHSANIRENDTILNFTFNISAMQQILAEQHIIKQYCQFNNSLISQLDIELEINLLWNQIETRSPKYSESSKNVPINQFYNEILYNYLSKSDDSKINKCENLNAMTNFLHAMNNELNALLMLNHTAIEELISPNLIIPELDTILGERENAMFPFSLEYGYNEDFFKNTNIEYLYSNYVIKISFEIPIYRKTNLKIAYTKPIIIDNWPYILKTDIKYVTVDSNKPIFLTKQNFINSCLFKNNTFFCEKIKHQKKFKCEKQMMKKQVEKQCLSRLEKQNMITQIHDTLYCIAFEPIIFEIKCNNTDYFMKIMHHSRITNEELCSFNNSFYRFDPNNSIPYEVVTYNRSNTVETIFNNIDISFWEIFITISYLIVLPLIYVLTIGLNIFKYQKNYNNNKNDEISSVQQHEYETIDYYV